MILKFEKIRVKTTEKKKEKELGLGKIAADPLGLEII